MLRNTLLLGIGALSTALAAGSLERRLYVTDRSGISVYDIDNGHTLVRKIDLPGTGDYKGIAASPQLSFSQAVRVNAPDQTDQQRDSFSQYFLSAFGLFDRLQRRFHVTRRNGIDRRVQQQDRAPMPNMPPVPEEVRVILEQSKALREKTAHASEDQLEDLARQQDALRQRLRAYRDTHKPK